MKERITTSISVLSEYWNEKVEPLLKNGFSVVGLFRLGVETAEQKKDEKKLDTEQKTI